MSAPRVIVEMFVTGVRVFGKATAAAGAQAVRNFKHKPEGAPSSGPVGTGSSKSQITNQMQMSLDEAHLILNVKKEDPMEIIEKNYQTIFKANSPPEEPAPSAKPAPASNSRQTPTSRKSKLPQHSHYLQSKVYRALERIKAERDTGAPTPPTEAADATAPAAAAPPPGSGAGGSAN